MSQSPFGPDQPFRGACAVCLADGRHKGSATYLPGFEPVFCTSCSAVTCRSCVSNRSHNSGGYEMHECPRCGQVNSVHFSDAHPFRWLIKRRQRGATSPPRQRDAPSKQEVLHRRKAIAKADAAPPGAHPTENERAPIWEVVASAPGPRLAPTLPRRAGMFSETAPINAFERFRDPQSHHRVFERTSGTGNGSDEEPPLVQPRMVFRGDDDPLYIKPAVEQALEEALTAQQQQQTQQAKQGEASTSTDADEEELLSKILAASGRVRPPGAEKRPAVPSIGETEKWHAEQREKLSARKRKQEEERVQRAVETRAESGGAFCSWAGESQAMGVAEQTAAVESAARKIEDASRQKLVEEKAKKAKEERDQIESRKREKEGSTTSEEENPGTPRVIVAWRERPKPSAGPQVKVCLKTHSPPVSPPVHSPIERLADPLSTLGGYERWEANETRRELHFKEKHQELAAKKERLQQAEREASRRAAPVVSESDMTKLAYGGYPSPVEVWSAEQRRLDSLAEAVPAVLPRTSPLETWGLSAELTVELRRRTYGEKDQKKEKEDEEEEKKRNKNEKKETATTRHGAQAVKRCSRMTLQQLSRPKQPSAAVLMQPESRQERQARQSTTRLRCTQLGGASIEGYASWKTATGHI
jgi:hypothetical protein